MEAIVEILPFLAAMTVLIGFSAFFSASEAALFSLRAADFRVLKSGSRAQIIAAKLLDDPDRLLTSVVFWNLVINVAYFAMASIAALELARPPNADRSSAVALTVGSLLTIIFFSEMLPKSLAVISPKRVASLVSIPLAICVRAMDPLLPSLRLVNLLSRRLIWPRFQPERYLEVGDLERAIELSTSDAALMEQEQAVLQNIVLLSEIRVDELMRPRMQFLSFRPPVALADLEGRLPPSGYLLVTEPDSDEIAAAIRLKDISAMSEAHLERQAEPVIYVPWCTSAAEALEQMQSRDRQVAAVVNEFGETIGILTFDDILDTLFTHSPSRSNRLLNRRPIHPQRPGVWQITGMTSLRRLGRYFDVQLPATKNVTVAGIVQELLQRLPIAGDRCDWGPFRFEVIDAPQRGQMLLELTRTDAEEGEP